MKANHMIFHLLSGKAYESHDADLTNEKAQQSQFMCSVVYTGICFILFGEKKSRRVRL
jgi:hypothetical protein